MKIDKGLKDLDNACSLLESELELYSNEQPTTVTTTTTTIKDDDYYLDRGERPSRFAYYAKVRWEKYSDWEKLTSFDPDETITHDELNFMLKRQLRIPPEERYRHNKANWFFHELSYLH